MVKQNNNINYKMQSSTSTLSKSSNLYANIDKACNRLILCIFAISLVWLTSIQVCVDIVDYYIKSPSFNSVIDTCDYSYNIINNEKDLYNKCQENQINLCNVEFNKELNNEINNINEKNNLNENIIIKLSNIENNCINNITKYENSINKYINLINQNSNHQLNYNDNCTNGKYI
jgi:hypothetical protein